MNKIKTSDEILEEAVEVEKNKVGEKKIVKEKKIPANEVDKQNEAKREKKLKEEKLKKSSEEKKNEQDCNNDENLIPWWFVELFDHLDYMEVNDMWIYKGKEEDANKRKKSPYELERKLFLIFSASPKKERIWDDPEDPITWWEWTSMVWRRRLIKLTDFANITWVNRNTLTTWKWEKWVQTAAVKLYLEYIEMHSQAIELTWKGWKDLMPSIINIIKPKELDIEPKEKENTKKTDKKVD